MPGEKGSRSRRQAVHADWLGREHAGRTRPWALEEQLLHGGSNDLDPLVERLSQEHLSLSRLEKALHDEMRRVEELQRQLTEAPFDLADRPTDQFPDGRRMPTWITNSFGAAAPKRHSRYALYMGIGAVAGGLIGGRTGRAAGIIGGTLTGFIIAGNRTGPAVRDLTLKAGQEIRLQLGEDLALAGN